MATENLNISVPKGTRKRLRALNPTETPTGMARILMIRALEREERIRYREKIRSIEKDGELLPQR